MRGRSLDTRPPPEAAAAVLPAAGGRIGATSAAGAGRSLRYAGGGQPALTGPGAVEEGLAESVADLEDFPGAKAQVFGNKGRARRSAPACTAPIEAIDMEAPRIDAERLKRLANGHATFMSAASPGVTALFFPNQFYASDEEYVFALAEGLRHEYETIAAAGITLQVDCPDLAMGRHVQHRDIATVGVGNINMGHGVTFSENGSKAERSSVKTIKLSRVVHQDALQVRVTRNPVG